MKQQRFAAAGRHPIRQLAQFGCGEPSVHWITSKPVNIAIVDALVQFSKQSGAAIEIGVQVDLGVEQSQILEVAEYDRASAQPIDVVKMLANVGVVTFERCTRDVALRFTATQQPPHHMAAACLVEAFTCVF